jgi:hypothetical protein
MVTITCQYTGVVFDADSRRQKNHPLVSKFLNRCAGDTNNPGAYNMALAAFRQAKAEGMTDIAEIMAFAERYVDEGGDLQRQARKERQARIDAENKAFEEKRQRAKEERRQINEFLKAHGYKWGKEAADFDEDEEGEPSEWVLRAPDGRAVTPAQAKDEIERGVEVVLAEIAAQEAAAEAKRQAAEAAERLDREQREAARAQVRALGQQCDPFDSKQLPILYELRDTRGATHIIEVRYGEIGGVVHGAIYEYWGGHDYTEYFEYWQAEA